MPSFEVTSNCFRLHVPLHSQTHIGVGTNFANFPLDVHASMEFDSKYAPLNMFDFTNVNGKEISCSDDGNVIAVGKDAQTALIYRRTNKWNFTSLKIEDLPKSYTGTLYISKSVSQAYVSKDGNRVVLVKGGIIDQHDGNVVEIYHYHNGSWSRKAFIHHYASLGWGCCMSADGNTVALTAPGSYAQNYKGSIYVYKYDAVLEEWKLSLERSYENWPDQISLNGDGTVLAVSLTSNPSSQYLNESCTAYVRVLSFVRGTWNDANNDVIFKAPSDTIYWQYFGKTVRVSKDGNMIVIGAPGFAGRGEFKAQNAVYIFKKDPASLLWNFTPYVLQPSYYDTTSTVCVQNLFGTSIAISDDNSVVVVGAPYETVNGVEAAGKVYVFKSSSKGVWSEQGSMHRSENRKYFGNSIDIARDNMHLYVMASKADVWGAIQYTFLSNGTAVNAVGDIRLTGEIYKGDNILNIDTDGRNVFVPYGGNFGIGTNPGAYSLNVAGGISLFSDSVYAATAQGTSVGIGLTEPSSKFHVSGESKFDGVVKASKTIELLSDLYGADNSDKTFISRGHHEWCRNHLVLHTNSDDGESGVAFMTNGAKVNMFVKANSGFVGLGTVWPEEKLHVVGGSKIEGDLNVAGDIINAGLSKLIDDLKATIAAQETRIKALEAKL